MLALDESGNTSVHPTNAARAMVADTTAPTAPSGLTATVTDRTVVLSWTGSTDADGVAWYDVYRSATAGFTPTGTAVARVTSGTTYSDQPGGGTWYYRVIAADMLANASAPSNETTATLTDLMAPTAPTVTATVSGGTVTVRWSGATDDVGVVSYDVYRSSSAGFTPATGNKIADVGARRTPTRPASEPDTAAWWP